MGVRISPSPRHGPITQLEYADPYVDGILAEPFELDGEGYLPIPAKPGLGVEIDRDKLGRYTPDPSPLFT